MTGQPARIEHVPGVAPRVEFEQLPAAQRIELIQSGSSLAVSPWQRLRAILALGRPRTCIPGLLCYVLGVTYTDASSAPRVLLGGVLAFLIGFVANLHNAYTDLEEDAVNLPGRGYLLLMIGYRRLPRILAWLTGSMIAASLPIGVEFFLFMVLAQIGLNQYSAPPFRTKSRPILGLWVFAQAVVFPFIFGIFIAPDELLLALVARCLGTDLGHGPVSAQVELNALRGIAMLVFLTLWFMAKGLIKNLPDYHGDRAARVRTVATMFASYRAAASVALIAVVATISCLAALVALGLEPARLLFALGWLLPIGWNGWRLVRAPDTAAANRYLAFDMLLSSGFIATVLLLLMPGGLAISGVVAGALLFAASDALGFDSRGAAEVAVRSVQS